MPTAEICSFCWLQHYAILQTSSYSAYDDFIESQLSYSNTRCGQTNPTSPPPPAISVPAATDFCATGDLYTTVLGETCDSIASANNVSSAALYLGNPDGIPDCDSITTGTALCLPVPCGVTYTLLPDDTCFSVEQLAYNLTGRPLAPGDLAKYNPWINAGCDNLHAASDAAFGHVLCLGPQNGDFNNDPVLRDTTVPRRSNGYSLDVVDPPAGAVVAAGTTTKCGVWHVAEAGDTCAMMSFGNGGTVAILLSVNPSLGTTVDGCTDNIVTGTAYCAIPYIAWDAVESPADSSITITDTVGHETSTSSTEPPSTASSEPSSPSTTSTEASTTSTEPSSSTPSTAAPPSSTSTAPPSTTTTYYGCYTEGHDVRALAGASFADATLMTPSYCQTLCSAGGYTLWGVEYGLECYCGDALGVGSIPTFESQCSFACPGDAAQTCGAGNRLSLYGASASPPAVTAPDMPSATTLSYLGCYTELAVGRALAGVSIADGTSMTVEACARFCFYNGLVVAGIEYAAECYCSTALDAGSLAAAEEDCAMACSGDALQVCGGPNRLSVYQWV